MSHILHHAIDVRARPETIWRVFTDLSTWPRWFPYATAAHSDDEVVWRTGGRIDVRMAVPVAGALRIHLGIVEVAAPDRVRWIGTATGMRGDHLYRFEDHGDWTRVTSHEELGGWMASAALRLARGRVEDAVHVSLEKLRDVVEESAARSAS